MKVGKQHQSGGYLVVEVQHERYKYGDNHARGFIHKRVKPKEDVWTAFYGPTYGGWSSRRIGQSADKATALKMVTDHIEAYMATKRKSSSTQASLFGGATNRARKTTKGAKWSQRSGYRAVRVSIKGHTRTVYKRKG